MPSMNAPLPPRTPKGKPIKKKKKKRLKIVLRWMLTILLLCILGAAGYGGYIYYKFNAALHRIADDPDKSPKNIAAEAAKMKKPVTFLLLGLDNREQTGSLNTDVIMVATFNPVQKSATIVSIPRDSYLHPSEWRSGHKANAFYAYSRADDKATAVQEVKRIFGEYLEVPIDYSAIIDFQTFRDIIDILGGVKVNVDMKMRYKDPTDGTNIHLDPGKQLLDGKNALDFVRYRKSNTPGVGESSDFDRNKRQQLVLHDIVNQLKSVEGIVKIPDIIDAVGKNVKMDMSSKLIKQFIATYRGIGNNKITYIPLEGVWESPYTQINDDSLDNARQKLQDELNGTNPKEAAEGSAANVSQE